MKKKISCQIIQDLLPNYIEGIISNESKESVKEHLDECAYCKKELDNMNTLIDIEPVEERKIDYLKGIYKKSKIILLACFILGVITFIISVFYNEQNYGDAVSTLALYLMIVIVIILKFILPLLGSIISILCYKKSKKKWLLLISVICICLFLYSLVSVFNFVVTYGF